MMRTECTPNKEENHRVVPFECELDFCEKGGRGEEVKGSSVKLGKEINTEERDDGKSRLR